MTKLLVFSGSTRTDSMNQKLARLLASQAEEQGASITTISLRDLELPIYDGDHEAKHGLPAGAVRFKALMLEHAGMIITSPEYNGFMTPLLINAIDWATRSEDAGVDLSSLANKTIVIASASPGPGGGGRSVAHLKSMLSALGAVVMPQSLTVPSAFNAFNAQDEFNDEKMTARAARLVGQFLDFTHRFE